MKIFLIRHGEQLYPKDEQGRKLVSGLDAPLVELGRRQLRELGTELVNEGEVLDALYISPVLRARQSSEELVVAAVISAANIHVIDELKETFPNSAEGKTYDDLAERGGDIYAKPFGSQESLDHLIEREKRAKEFILSDARRRGYKSIGIVGHGDPLCAWDWSLKHTDLPISYGEMRDSYYPQKGQALVYIIDANLQMVGEGRIITTESAKQTIEGFRNFPQKEAE